MTCVINCQPELPAFSDGNTFPSITYKSDVDDDTSSESVQKTLFIIAKKVANIRKKFRIIIDIFDIFNSTAASTQVFLRLCVF